MHSESETGWLRKSLLGTLKQQSPTFRTSWTTSGLMSTEIKSHDESSSGLDIVKKILFEMSKIRVYRDMGKKLSMC